MAARRSEEAALRHLRHEISSAAPANLTTWQKLLHAWARYSGLWAEVGEVLSQGGPSVLSLRACAEEPTAFTKTLSEDIGLHRVELGTGIPTPGNPAKPALMERDPN